MSDLNIIGNIKTQTAAQWALDFTVYTNQKILVTSDVFYTGTDQAKFSIANGTDVWAALDYMPIGGGTDTVCNEFFHTNGTNLANNADYFIGTGTTMGNTINSSVVKSIEGGEGVVAHISAYVGGTFGSNEDATVTLFTNGGVDSVVLSTTVKFDARNNSYIIPISHTVVAGEAWIVLDTPVGGYATNPSAAKLDVLIYTVL